MSLALALALLVVGRGRAVNALLGAHLALNGVNWGIQSATRLTGSEFLLYNGYAYFLGTGYALIVVYPLFLGAALHSPLVRPLRPRPVVLAGIAAAALLTLLPALRPEWFFDVADASWNTRPIAGAAFEYGTSAAFAFALLVALDAWRRAPPGSRERSDAGRYAILFGIYDAMWVLDVSFLKGADARAFETYLFLPYYYLFLVLLVHTIARHQLLGLDLRIKWTLRRGTLIGIFLGVFFIVVAVAEQYLQRYGAILGGVAVGLMLLALRPIERMADRFAEAAMPGVQPTPAYLAHKRIEVYKVAVESALETGGIDARERVKLEKLRDKLGLSPGDVAAVEADATS